MSDLECPVCNELEDFSPFHKLLSEGFYYTLFNKCGHRLILDDLDKSIEEQKTRYTRSTRSTGH